MDTDDVSLALLSSRSRIVSPCPFGPFSVYLFGPVVVLLSCSCIGSWRLEICLVANPA